MQFFDLQNQYYAIKKDFLKALASIHLKGEYILGEEVKRFEKEFSQYCGAKYAVGVNSGQDALFFSLKCLNISKGDEVIVPAFSFIATSFAVTMTGAKPVFVDIDEKTYTVDIQQVKKRITKRTKAILPVHLFGLCAAMSEIRKIAKRNRLSIIEDAAQAHGACIKGQMAGSFGTLGCFSFYPTKNLGAFGDGGMITTSSKKCYTKLMQLRDCGRAKKRYLHPALGYNSRLDNIQAAGLRLKLKKLESWNRQRIQNALLYTTSLKKINGVITPYVPRDHRHVFHVYSIRTKKRKQLITELTKNKIPSSIFYPLSMHLQKANKYLGYKRGDFPISEAVSKEFIVLPIHPMITEKDIQKIIKIIRKVHNG